MNGSIDLVKILAIKEIGGRAFAKVVSQGDQIHWEEISLEEAKRYKRRIDGDKSEPELLRTYSGPPIRPVVRIGENGSLQFGSVLCYKGVDERGRHEYWHIPTGMVLVENEGYAERQMADTFLRLEIWLLERRL